MTGKKEIVRQGFMREAILLFAAISFIGLSQGFSENIWTNFYNIIGMQTSDRTLLEPIRELPGLALMFIIAALSFLTVGRMGTTAMVFRSIGLFCVGMLTETFSLPFVVYMVVISLGDHIFMPLRNTIGISIANPGYEGRVLGMMDAATTIMYAAASLPILLVFSGKQIGDYRILFVLSSGAALIAGLCLFFMRTRNASENISKPRLVLKKKYLLYYFISFISGMRKQIYLVFAPWLLVKTFSMPLKTMTLLNIIGAVTVFFFNPFVGHLIDKYGERKLLIGGGIFCVIIYIAYAFLSTQSRTDPVVLFALLALSYIDRLTQSTLIGRDIYVKHTADSPDEIMPTLSVGVSMDHVASVIAPIFGGILWVAVGEQWVFAAGAVIGLVYTCVCTLVPGKRI